MRVRLRRPGFGARALTCAALEPLQAMSAVFIFLLVLAQKKRQTPFEPSATAAGEERRAASRAALGRFIRRLHWFGLCGLGGDWFGRRDLGNVYELLG